VNRPVVGPLIQEYLVQGSCIEQGWAIYTCLQLWVPPLYAISIKPAYAQLYAHPILNEIRSKEASEILKKNFRSKTISSENFSSDDGFGSDPPVIRLDRSTSSPEPTLSFSLSSWSFCLPVSQSLFLSFHHIPIFLLVLFLISLSFHLTKIPLLHLNLMDWGYLSLIYFALSLSQYLLHCATH